MIEFQSVSPWTISRVAGCEASSVMSWLQKSGLGDTTVMHPIPVCDIIRVAVAQGRALEKILDVVGKYLPPDGIEAQEALSEIVVAVDPYPHIRS